MAKLSSKDVSHVAKLAKLDLTKEELEKFRDQLSKIITYFEHLEEVDTSKVEPTSHTAGLENVRRDDVVEIKDNLSVDEALSGTEKVHNGYFVVPMVLKDKKG